MIGIYRDMYTIGTIYSGLIGGQYRRGTYGRSFPSFLRDRMVLGRGDEG